MAPNVTIRNVTNYPLTLVKVEHFDPEQEQGGFQIHHITKALSNITNSVGITNTTTRKAVPQIAPDAQPFESRDVNIRLEPFRVVGTDIRATINKEKERLRLTFRADDAGEHRMYCPVPTVETPMLEAIGPNPPVRFTGVYLPEDSFVAIYVSSDRDDWMRDIPDETPLGALSIPGTHNSPTCYNAPPSVRCQAVSPTEQLKNGVRFFDLRVQVPEPFDPGSDKLALVHSVFPISLTGTKYFRDLYNGIRKFLDEHPAETIIVSLKREGTGKGTDQQLSKILIDHYARDRWFTEPRVPTLGEARGKVVLVRRFGLDDSLRGEWNGRGWGIDAQSWADNTANSMCPSGDVCVQDFYEVLEKPSIEKKITYAREHLERSGCCTIQPGQEKVPLYVNFLSASNFWKVDTWPEKIAAEVNPAVVEHLCKQHMVAGDGGVKDGCWSTGIVIADWVGLDKDWDLVTCITGMNAKLKR